MSDWQSGSARRSLWFCAAGAIVGLGIAGAGLFTAKGTRTASVPPDSVATVNQVPILRSDFLLQLRTLYDVSLSEATAAQKRKVLDDMVREELYVQRGVELGLPAYDTETRAALVTAAESQAASDALTSPPSEADLHAFFAAHRDRYASAGTMTLKELKPTDNDPATAAKAVAALKAGTPPAAAMLVTTGKVDDGEEFYFAARIHLGDAVFRVAETMADGAIAGPLKGPDGPVILVMAHNIRPVPQDFPAARPRVRDDFISASVERLTTANDRFLRKRAEIITAPDIP